MLQKCQDQQIPGCFPMAYGSYGFGVSAFFFGILFSEAHDLWDLFGSRWRESGHLWRAHVRRAVGLNGADEGLVADLGMSILW